MMSFKKTVGLITVTLTLMTLMACSVEPAAKVDGLSIGTLKGPSGVSLLKLMDTTNPLGDNTTITYAVEAQPDILTAKLLAGELDFATIPTNTAAILKNKGADYRIAAMNTWGVLYVVGTDETIDSIEDLKGQNMFSVGQGTTPDLVLSYLLSKKGLDKVKDLAIDYSLPHQELASALVAGQVQIAMLPEPFVTMALQQNKDLRVLIDIQKEWTATHPSNGPLPQTCLVVKGSLVDQHPKTVEAFLKAYDDSLSYANDYPVETGLLAEKLELFPKAKVIELAIPRLMLENMDMAQAKPLLEGYFQTLMEIAPEAIGGKLPDETLYALP